MDIASGKETAKNKVGEEPNHIVVSPDGRFVYVSSIGSADISIIDVSTLTVIGNVRVGNAAHEMEIAHLYDIEVPTG